MGDGTDDPTIDPEAIFDDLAAELDDFETRLTRPNNYICLCISSDRDLKLINLRELDVPEGLRVPKLTDAGDDLYGWSYNGREFNVGTGYRDAARMGWPIVGIYDMFSTSDLQQMLDDALENAEYLG
jgi:hypothetical protein